jgi:hypothetical protein
MPSLPDPSKNPKRDAKEPSPQLADLVVRREGARLTLESGNANTIKISNLLNGEAAGKVLKLELKKPKTGVFTSASNEVLGEGLYSIKRLKLLKSENGQIEIIGLKDSGGKEIAMPFLVLFDKKGTGHYLLPDNKFGYNRKFLSSLILPENKFQGIPVAPVIPKYGLEAVFIGTGDKRDPVTALKVFIGSGGNVVKLGLIGGNILDLSKIINNTTPLFLPAVPEEGDLELMPPDNTNPPVIPASVESVPIGPSIYPLDPKAKDLNSDEKLRFLVNYELETTKDSILKEALQKVRHDSFEHFKKTKKGDSCCFEMKALTEIMMDKSEANKERLEALELLCDKWRKDAFGGGFLARLYYKRYYPDYFENVAQIYGFVSSLLYIK